jgi:4-hydroxybenzoate polyprenyltransferase
MISSKTLRGLVASMRPYQWTKNLAVFAAMIFNGQLFNGEVVIESLLAFVVFSLFSSGSYLINDIVDAPYDRRHPQKRNRPIAKGTVTPQQAIIWAIFLFSLGLSVAFYLSFSFVLLIIAFLILHLIYSFILKKIAILDIFGISFSFILRTFAGEIATGFHLPVWLMFTVVFLSLFIASGKRRSEYVKEGSKTRPTLGKYQKALLNFYLSIFSVLTLISYSLFTYLAQPADFSQPKIHDFFVNNFPFLIGRKWLMITIFPVILGIMRYSQLVLERKRGERPGKILASDIPLLVTVFTWGFMLIVIIYVL